MSKLLGYAEWNKSEPNDDEPNVLESEYKERIFCRRHSGSLKSQRTGEGTVYRTYSLALISSDEKAKGIKPDDGIVWDGVEYSVSSTQSVPSARAFGAEDTIIFLV